VPEGTQDTLAGACSLVVCICLPLTVPLATRRRHAVASRRVRVLGVAVVLASCVSPKPIPPAPSLTSPGGRACLDRCEHSYLMCAEGTGGSRAQHYAAAPNVFQGYATDTVATKARNACIDTLSACYGSCRED
jgi:hypothetical protein